MGIPVAFESKTPTKLSSEGFLVDSVRIANLFDNVGILASFAFSESGALKL